MNALPTIYLVLSLFNPDTTSVNFNTVKCHDTACVTDLIRYELAWDKRLVRIEVYDRQPRYWTVTGISAFRPIAEFARS